MPKDVLPSSDPNGTGNDDEEKYDNKVTTLIPTRTNVFFFIIVFGKYSKMVIYVDFTFSEILSPFFYTF